MAQTIKLKRSAVPSAAPSTSDLALGEVAINTYDGKLYIKKDVGGTESIVEVSGGGAAPSGDYLYERTTYTATASQTTFVADYYIGFVDVWLNGIKLIPGTDFTATNGTSIVLASGATSGDSVEILAWISSDLTNLIKTVGFDTYSYTATSSQTTFSGSDDNSATLAYTAGHVQVFMNGILLDGDSEYTASNGTSVVLSVAASLNDIIKIIAFKAEDASIADLVVNGDLTVTGTTSLGSSINNTIIGNITPAAGSFTTLDTTGTVGIDAGAYAANAVADDLVVGDGTGTRGVSIVSANASNGYLIFADAAANNVGQLYYSHSADSLNFRFGNAGVTPFTMTSTALAFTGTSTFTNAGTGNGVFIDQNGNGVALNIDSESTTIDTVQIASDALTTGRIMDIATNSASFSGNGAFKVSITNASASGQAFRVQNEGTGNGVLIDQNGNGTAINVDSEATSATTVKIASEQTSAPVVEIVNNGIHANSGDASSLFVRQVQATTDAPVIRVENDGAGSGVFIDQNGNSQGLYIDSEATSSQGLYVNANVLTTGNGIYAYTNSSVFSSAGGLLRVIVENASATGVAANIRNDGTGTGMVIDQNGNGGALNIDSEATSATVANIVAQNTSGSVVSIVNNAAQVSGQVFNLTQENASSSTFLAALRNDGTGIGLFIDQNGNSPALFIDSEATSSNPIYVIGQNTTGSGIRAQFNNLTSGAGFYISSDSSATNSRNIVFINQENASATGAKALLVRQASTANALEIDQNGSGNALYTDGGNVVINNGNLTVSGTITGTVSLPIVKLTTTQTSSVTQGSPTTHTWDSQEFIDTATYTHSTSTNPSRLTVDATGYYNIIANLVYDNNTDSARNTVRASVYVNGTEEPSTRTYDYDRGALYGERSNNKINTILSLNANDYIEIRAYGYNIDGTCAIKANENELMIMRIQ
jgi:hypothetical protein